MDLSAIVVTGHGYSGPLKVILDFAYGEMPDGSEWNWCRQVRIVSMTFSLAWMQYNLDTETVGPNRGVS